MTTALTPTGDVTSAEKERLAKLTEELGEVQQVVGKILLHGYVAADPLTNQVYNNRADLQNELGDLGSAIRLMIAARDVSATAILNRADYKADHLTLRMKHQADEVIANFKQARR